ncbi:MAG: AAA family ATPase [Deltaproteobacteria bacterium]|nr:AAA family ATPase [Deltaproteobacteria bacterium]
MKIESLRLRNFRAFKAVELKDLPTYAIFVGANGVGKSTLFSVFAFLREAFTSNVSVALTKLGGSRGLEELRTRGEKGPVEIELKFRPGTGAQLMTYLLSVDQAPNGRPVVTREVLKYRRGQHGQPWRFLDFQDGEGTAVTNELEKVKDVRQLKRENHTLKSPDILAIKGLAQFEKFPAVKALGTLIENWHLSDFHISRARPEQEAGYATHLSREGENLSLVVDYLQKSHPETFKKILDALGRRVPGIAKVESKVTEEGKVLLKFKDGAFLEPFLARHVSDGTIRMLAYLALLYDPQPHPLLCVEEPENQIYTSLLAELSEEFRSYAERGGQVFVSTHSPDFLNAARLEEVYWMVKTRGTTRILRASDSKQISALIKAGDQLGFLWRQGMFEGAHPE